MADDTTLLVATVRYLLYSKYAASYVVALQVGPEQRVRAGVSGGDVPVVEEQRGQAVWKVSHVAAGVGGVGSVGFGAMDAGGAV